MATRVLEISDIGAATSDALFMDIETCAPAEQLMEKLKTQFIAEWTPPGNVKDPEKIAAKRTEDLRKMYDKAALLPQAPVAVVGLMLGTGETYLLHGMHKQKPEWVNKKRKVSAEGFAGEKELMSTVGRFLDENAGPQTLLTGFNILGFDLPKLRLAFVRNNLALPAALQLKVVEDDTRQPVFDLMVQYCRKFLGGHELFITQEEMLEQMGIRPLLKRETLSGAEVPSLLAEGKIDAVLTKNLADLMDLREAFLRMTGRS